MESIEEARVHFEITGKIGGEAEGTLPIAFATGGNEKAFGKAKWVGCEAVRGGARGFGFRAGKGEEQKARIALAKGVKGGDRLREVSRRGESEGTGERFPGTARVA